MKHWKKNFFTDEKQKEVSTDLHIYVMNLQSEKDM